MPSSLLHALLRATAFRHAVLRTLVPSIGLAFTLQGAVALPSILAGSERFYDLSGSLTYLSVVALSLYLPAIRVRAAAAATTAAVDAGKVAGATTAASLAPPWPSLLEAFTRHAPLGATARLADGAVALNWRQVVLSAAVGLWATRLGTFLFRRVLSDGHDSRFDEIKKSPVQFFGAFMAQAAWVSLCALPVVAVNSLPAATFARLPTLLTTDVVGLALFAGGWAFEIVADRQKAAWSDERRRKVHDEQFLTRGLWSRSRHPNYFGESTLWTGIAVVAAGVLASRAGVAALGFSSSLLAGRATGVAMAAASPAFVTFLLLKVSGVPLSENKYDQKFGDRKDYQEWKRNTPMFIPKL